VVLVSTAHANQTILQTRVRGTDQRIGV